LILQKASRARLYNYNGAIGYKFISLNFIKISRVGLIAYIGLFIVSLAVLLIASDKFIEAAEKIGLSIGISPFVIGVTIVAFGTSLPELATSIAAIYSGSSEIVAGNVIGSNITNILLVLGITAIVAKEINLNFDVMQTDMSFLLGSAFLLYFALQDGNISLFEAVLFLVVLGFFLFNSFTSEKTDKSDRPSVSLSTFFILILGAVFVFLGAKYTIFAMEGISNIMGVSPDIIALTGVALGTSLPELIVSINASKRGKHAIAVGNVLGSNLFNTLGIMGVPRLFGDLKISHVIQDFTSPFMVGVTVLFCLVCLSKRIHRTEGYLLVLFYVYFIAELFMN